jgi:hypothetical protein
LRVLALGPPTRNKYALIVNPYAELPRALALQGLKAITRQCRQISQRRGRLQTVEFHPRGAFESGKRLKAFSGSEGASPRIAIAEDHCMILRWIMRYVKRNEWPYG